MRVGGLGKELHYFDRFWNGEVPTDFVERYHAYFPRPEGKRTGEWTPRYMHDHWTMGLLRHAAPDARILIMLRDPVDRFRSGFGREIWMAERDGREVNLDLVADAVARGRYEGEVRRVLDSYPHERVLVLQFERCRDDPVAELRRTWEFLELDPTAEVPERLFRHVPSRAPRPDLGDADAGTARRGLPRRRARPGQAVSRDRPLPLAEVRMRIVMTLKVRDEADVIDANLRFHLAAGADFFIVTDNGSTDGTRGGARALSPRRPRRA